MEFLNDRTTALGFADRARKNLRHIEAQRSEGSDVHEVTQIVLSLLGMVVVPWERKLKKGMQHRTLDELDAEGWPKWEITIGTTPNLAYLVRRLRNATAHGRFRFSSDSLDPNDVFVVVDDNNRQGDDAWQAKIVASDLKEFCYRFLDLIEQELD